MMKLANQAEAELVKLVSSKSGPLVEEMSNWTRGRDPWSLMQPADVAQLEAQMKRAREEFHDFARYYAPGRRNELETLALVTMASADAPGYAALPEPVRKLIN